jgi:hypothetical protein
MADPDGISLLLGEIKGELKGMRGDIGDIKKEQIKQREIVTNQRIKSAKVAGLVTVGGIGLWEVVKQKFSIG